MIKSRTLNADVGDHPQCKYWNSGTACPKSSGSYIDRMARPSWYYYEGRSKAASLSNVPSNLGSQRFESSTRRMPKFNNCENIRYQGFNLPFLIILEHPTNSSYVSSMMDYSRKAVVGAFSNVGTVPIIPWAEADASQRRAWWAMQPRFESEVSMLNFIFELKDFKDLLKLAGTTKYGWSKKASSLGKLRDRMVKEANALTSTAKTIAAASKIWSKVWLANAFALQPLLKDLGAIASQIEKTADAAQEEFSKRGLEAQTSHYSEVLDESSSGTWDATNLYFYGVHRKTLFTATMQYTYDYTVRNGYELLRRYWGLDVTAGVIWEAIPFSFLVDYFIKVGNAIDFMDTDANVFLNMLQYCESLYVEATSGTHIDTSNSAIKRFYSPTNHRKPSVKGLTPISGVEATYYHRIVTSPNKGAALPRVSCPTKGQKWNMLALVRGFMK